MRKLGLRRLIFGALLLIPTVAAADSYTDLARTVLGNVRKIRSHRGSPINFVVFNPLTGKEETIVMGVHVTTPTPRPTPSKTPTSTRTPTPSKTPAPTKMPWHTPK